METVRCLKNSVRGYYEAINEICSATLTDPEFDIQLHGYGFDNSGFAITSRTDFEEVTSVTSLTAPIEAIKVLRGYGTQALYVHRDVTVFESVDRITLSTSLEQQIQLFAESLSGQGNALRLRIVNVRAHSSSDTKFPLSKAIHHCAVSDSNPDCPSSAPAGHSEFCLASDVMARMLRDAGGNLALMHLEALCSVKEELDADGNSLQISPVYAPNPGKLMVGVEQVIAFKASDWPTSASLFQTRSRVNYWPTQETIDQIISNGVLIVPKLPNKPNPTKTSSRTAPADNTITHTFTWKYCFAGAERILFSSLNEATLDVMHNLYVFANAVTHFYGRAFEKDLVSLLKTAFFWCLEDREINVDELTSYPAPAASTSATPPPPSDETSPKFKATHTVLTYLYRKLQNNRFSHYFLTDCNAFEDYDAEFLSRVRGILEELLPTPADIHDLLVQHDLTLFLCETIATASRQTGDDYCRQIVAKSMRSIHLAYGEMYRLAWGMLFGRLHSKPGLDSSIETHEAVQRLLSKALRRGGSTRVIEWCALLVTNSVANLYLTKALNTPPPKRAVTSPQGSERGHYMQKAEDMLLMSHNTDYMCGRVLLANYYLLTNRLEEAHSLLVEMLSPTANQSLAPAAGVEAAESSLDSLMVDSALLASEFSSESNCEASSSTGVIKPMKIISSDHVKSCLLDVIYSRSCRLDLLFSAHEIEIIPDCLQGAISLSNATLLGMLPTSICQYDADVIAQFLYAIVLMKAIDRDSQSAASKKPPSSTTTTMSDNAKLSDNMIPPGSGSVFGSTEAMMASAVGALKKLEQLCHREQRDMNERRNVAYFNALAKCYMALKLRDDAMRALDESIAISPSPIRNPAVFMRSSMGRDATKFLLKGGVYAALAVGLLAMFMNLTRTRPM